jgi:translation elongation factor EF-G
MPGIYINGSKLTNLGTSGDIDISSIISSYSQLAGGCVGVVCVYDGTMQLDDFMAGDL